MENLEGKKQCGEEDEFGSLEKLCHPTASQEAESPICSMTRGSERISPDPVSNPFVKVWPPGRSCSVQAQEHQPPPLQPPQPPNPWSDVGRVGEIKDDVKGKRQLPVYIEVKDAIVGKDGDGGKKKETIMDYLDVLKAIFRERGDGGKDVDLVETAKSRGLKFPKPRWKD